MDQPAITHTPPRVHRSSEQWQTIVDQFETSGLSQRAFCQQVGISYGTFTRWRRRLMRADTQQPLTMPDADLFVEVSAGSGLPVTTPAWDVELQLGPDVVLRLRHPSC
jgi:putative transposase